MSYEGREVYICENGHDTWFDAMSSMYGGGDDLKNCAYCGSKKFNWFFSIDDTNFEGVEPDLIYLTQPEFHKCECGHIHCVKEATVTPNPQQPGWRKL